MNIDGSDTQRIVDLEVPNRNLNYVDNTIIFSAYICEKDDECTFQEKLKAICAIKLEDLDDVMCISDESWFHVPTDISIVSD